MEAETPNKYTCPLCGVALEIKLNRETLKEFLGCPNYWSNPQCFYTESLPIEIWKQREPQNEEEYKVWKRLKDDDAPQS
jgi:ssDNA-binding Zn-finger/Zn-ribbon topoisomerase 1